jgi:photosystem II stability/assembly factor-like uncharacterized protein
VATAVRRSAAPMLLLALVALAAMSAPWGDAERYEWRNVAIVGGGFVTGIAFSEAERDLIYARTDIGGVYRWGPAAERWTPLTDWIGMSDWNLLGIDGLALDPSDARRVYLAAGAYNQDWAPNAAILRSEDRGDSWERIDLPLRMGGNEDGRSMGERLVVDRNDGRCLYLGTRDDGLWRSYDYGRTWTPVASFQARGTAKIGVTGIAFDPRVSTPGVPTQSVYVAVADPAVSLYHTDDGGVSWLAVAGQPRGLLPHHVAFGRAGDLYVTYASAPGPNGMTDGAVWRHRPDVGAWDDVTPISPGEGSEGDFGYAGLAVDPQMPGVVVVATMNRWWPRDELFRTTDAGAHWTALGETAARDGSASPYLRWGRQSVELGHWIGSIGIDPYDSDNALYATGATVWGSDDLTAADAGQPTRWKVAAMGIEETAVLDLISPPVGAPLLSALGDLGGFRHDDITQSPSDGAFDDPRFVTGTSLDFAAHDPEFVVRVGSTRDGDPHGAYSMDGGRAWTAFETEPANEDGRGAVAISADAQAIVWTPDGARAHVSHDLGKTWRRCKGLPERAAAISDRNAAGVFYARDPADGDVHVSVDAGVTFTVMAAGLPSGRGQLTAAPSEAGDLWIAVRSHGLYRAAARGQPFSKAPGVEEAYAVGFGKAAPGHPLDTVYMTGTVRGVAGVYRSTDGAEAWTRINDDRHQYGGIDRVVIGDPRVFGRVYLATNGRGIVVGDPTPAR